MYLAHMNWREAEAALRTPDLIVVVPLGSTEQHGPIGPLGTDFIIPDHLAARIEQRTDVLVVPTMPFGVALHHTNFPGTIDIGLEGLYIVMKGVVENLMRHGARKFLFLNGHGGNDPSLDKVGLEAFRNGALCAQINWWALAPMLNPTWTTGHGDAQEVAMVRAIDPALIHDASYTPTTVNNMTANLENTHLGQVRFKNAAVKVIRDVRATVNTGGFGGLDSSLGTLEWGTEMLDAVVEYCVAFVDEFRTVDNDKAHTHE